MANSMGKMLKPWADQMWALLNKIDWKMVEKQFPTFLAVRDKLFALIHKVDSLTNTVRKAEGHIDEAYALYRKLGCFVAGTPVQIAAAASDSSPFSDDFDPYSWNRNDEIVCRAALALAPDATTTAVNIENVRLGSRVLTENPRPEDFDFSFPEPERTTWRKISLTVQRNDGAVVWIEALRPQSWIDELGLAPGRLTPVNYPELRLEGVAEIISIEPCPLIAEGPGSVITSKVVTTNAKELVRVLFADGNELVGTASHPVWNVTLQDWTPTGELVPGDYVLADGTPLAVTSVTRLTVDEPVYNLEVHGEHVFEAGHNGVLVHNSDAQCQQFLKQYDELMAAGNTTAARELAETRIGRLKELPGLSQKRLDELQAIENEIVKNGGWVRPKGWRLPKNGRFDGTPGHSTFIPNNPSELGLDPGDVIPFRYGIPDFSKWSKGN